MVREGGKGMSHVKGLPFRDNHNIDVSDQLQLYHLHVSSFNEVSAHDLPE